MSKDVKVGPINPAEIAVINISPYDFKSIPLKNLCEIIITSYYSYERSLSYIIYFALNLSFIEPIKN